MNNKFSDSLLSTILNQYYHINLKSMIFTFDFYFQHTLYEKNGNIKVLRSRRTP